MGLMGIVKKAMAADVGALPPGMLDLVGAVAALQPGADDLSYAPPARFDADIRAAESAWGVAPGLLAVALSDYRQVRGGSWREGVAAIQPAVREHLAGRPEDLAAALVDYATAVYGPETATGRASVIAGAYLLAVLAGAPAQLEAIAGSLADV